MTDEEVAAPLPGDEIVPDARVVIDRATTLAAPPERVWPWIVQLGKRRAGWYFPRWIEVAIPRERRGLRHVEPRWQRLAVGDVIPDWGGPAATFEVAVLDPPRALVHRSTRERRDGDTDPDQLGARAHAERSRARACTCGCGSARWAAGRRG